MVLTVFELCAFKFFFEAWELFTPLRNAVNIAEPRVVFCTKTFSRHDNRDARWIRDNANGRNTPGQFVQRELFAAPGHMVLECRTRQLDRRRYLAERIGLEFV